MTEELWDALAASFGPVLLEAFPGATPRLRLDVCNALRDEVRKRETWFQGKVGRELDELGPPKTVPDYAWALECWREMMAKYLAGRPARAEGIAHNQPEAP